MKQVYLSYTLIVTTVVCACMQNSEHQKPVYFHCKQKQNLGEGGTAYHDTEHSFPKVEMGRQGRWGVF